MNKKKVDKLCKRQGVKCHICKARFWCCNYECIGKEIINGKVGIFNVADEWGVAVNV